MPIDWERIVVEHGQMVLQTAMRIPGHPADAEDVVQDVLMEVYSRTPSDVRNWGGLPIHRASSISIALPSIWLR